MALSGMTGFARREGALGAWTWSVDRWRSDPDAVFSVEQRTIIEVIATLVTDRRLSTALWSRACDRLGPEAALELLMAYAWWGGFVRVVIESVLPLSDTPPSPRPG